MKRIMALLLTFVMLPIFMANSSPWVGITSHPPYENYDDRLSEGFFDVQIDSVAQHRGSNHRSKRMVSGNALGTMLFGGQIILIYEATYNQFSYYNSSKLFYHTPLFELDSNNVSVTNWKTVHFQVRIWNEKLQSEVANLTQRLVGHQVSRDQVKVLPLLNMKLYQPNPPFFFQIDDTWDEGKQYKNEQFWRFELKCSENCNTLVDVIKSKPHLLADMSVKFTCNEALPHNLFLTYSAVHKSSFMDKLKRRFPNASEIFLTDADSKTLLSEIITNLVDQSVDMEFFITDETREDIRRVFSKNNLADMLKREIDENQSQQVWDSLYWEKENYRPDKCSKAFTDFYRKLDPIDDGHFLWRIFRLHSSISEASPSLITGLSEVKQSIDPSGTSLVSFMEIMRRNIRFDGEKFVPNSITVYTLNLANLLDPNKYNNKDVSVKARIVRNRPIHVSQPDSNIYRRLTEIEAKLKVVNEHLNKMDKHLNPEIKNSRNVVFFAQRNDDLHMKQNQYINYHFANINEGNGLDLATGIFKAPIKGVYYFCFSAVKKKRFYPTLTNKMTVKLVYVPSNRTIAKGHVSSSDPYTWAPVLLHATVSLDVNESIAVLLNEGYLYDPAVQGDDSEKNLLTSFSGFLLLCESQSAIDCTFL